MHNTVEEVLDHQDKRTEVLLNEIVSISNEMRETFDLKLCLAIEYRMKELLLNSGIFIEEMRDVSEDVNFGR